MHSAVICNALPLLTLCPLRCGPQEELKLETTFLSQRNIALNTQIRSCGFYDPDAVAGAGELRPRATHTTGGAEAVRSHGTAEDADLEAEAAGEVCVQHSCMWDELPAESSVTHLFLGSKSLAA